ncbi:hypothetical protein HS125_04585 [bacterium]|nr:hypothetical protein [bacterium]
MRTKDGKKWRETADSAQGYVLQTRQETPEEWFARLYEHVAARLPEYYQRREYGRTPEEIEEHMRDVWATTQGLLECRRANRWPRTANIEQCAARNSKCEYYELCVGRELPNETSHCCGWLRGWTPHTRN